MCRQELQNIEFSLMLNRLWCTLIGSFDESLYLSKDVGLIYKTLDYGQNWCLIHSYATYSKDCYFNTEDYN